jgi:hypothetical protein
MPLRFRQGASTACVVDPTGNAQAAFDYPKPPSPLWRGRSRVSEMKIGKP